MAKTACRGKLVNLHVFILKQQQKEKKNEGFNSRKSIRNIIIEKQYK